MEGFDARLAGVRRGVVVEAEVDDRPADAGLEPRFAEAVGVAVVPDVPAELAGDGGAEVLVARLLPGGEGDGAAGATRRRRLRPPVVGAQRLADGVGAGVEVTEEVAAVVVGRGRAVAGAEGAAVVKVEVDGVAEETDVEFPPRAAAVVVEEDHAADAAAVGGGECVAVEGARLVEPEPVGGAAPGQGLAPAGRERLPDRVKRRGQVAELPAARGARRRCRGRRWGGSGRR